MKSAMKAIHIPDTHLLSALQEIGVIKIGTDSEIKLIRPTTIRELNLEKRAIADLTGIEHFRRLTILRVSGNKLKTLELHHYVHLEVLHADYNQLTKVDCRPLTRLKELRMDHNQIDELLLPASNRLFRLDISHNRLQFLPLADCPKLRVLQCAVNPLDRLDLSSHHLIYLSVDKQLARKVKVDKGRPPELFNKNEDQDGGFFYELWFINKFHLALGNTPMELFGWQLYVLMKKYDEGRLYHRFSKGDLIIKSEILSYTGYFTLNEYKMSPSDPLDLIRNGSAFVTEVSLIDLPRGSFPVHVTITEKNGVERRFRIREGSFTYLDNEVGDLQYFRYQEVNDRLPAVSLYLIND